MQTHKYLLTSQDEFGSYCDNLIYNKPTGYPVLWWVCISLLCAFMAFFIATDARAQSAPCMQGANAAAEAYVLNPGDVKPDTLATTIAHQPYPVDVTHAVNALFHITKRQHEDPKQSVYVHAAEYIKGICKVPLN